MSEMFNDDHRYWQDQFDSRRIADRIDGLLVSETIDTHAKSFIEARDMFFLATCDADGHPQCSYKGGEPGFVRVLDEHTLAFPVYDGNGMFLSLGNISGHAEVGMLFIDFEQPNRLRVNGTARVALDDPLTETYPGARLTVRVTTREVFPNCSRYIHQMQLVERSKFVPHANVEPPIPDWKRMTWAQEYLPEGDPARDVDPISRFCGWGRGARAGGPYGRRPEQPHRHGAPRADTASTASLAPFGALSSGRGDHCPIAGVPVESVAAIHGSSTLGLKIS
jgi:predicted pyridoxine 5'-phosphate oxidase superfamily flavin-nucleotide-binding protein